MSFIKKGLLWHQAQRHVHCTEEVMVDGVPLLATVPDVSSFVEQEGIKNNVQYFTFIFRASDLADIDLVRGSTVHWEGKDFEVAYDKRQLIEYDDPNRLDIAVHTTERS